MSATDSTTALKRTPFHDIHVKLGAKMVPFAGFEMPVQYPTGITAEHNAVRRTCGLFDVSHMGEFRITGPQAVAFVTAVTTNDVAALAVGQVHYSGILNDRGTFEDDCLVYRFADHVMMVVNASNKDKDFAHISKQLSRFDVKLEDISDHVALLALQGPEAQKILQPLTGVDLEAIGYYYFAQGAVAGIPNVIVSRTGYTGEDGFELYFDPAHAEKMWDAVMRGGRVTPTGLGCRDSLRLEMGMALYGNDIDDTVTPLEANLGWIVKLKKGDFTGRAALEAQKAAGVPRKLVGFTVADRAFPRHGYPVFVNGAPSGEVRSGTMSPSCNVAIGTAYVPAEHARPGNTLEVEIRGKRFTGTIVKLPFYQHASHR
ncbi:MAG: glycine cleavage system aminomethyltransferase GcvT [Gemmatimonadota bacterium]|nr:glycine cleavage system aminomethyltransferase GcvT [Gemmatimonadota bacterium]MDE3217093.1 glycine cleavage system aminomethyltransferase GcvT [Gemmatimonadota bacterium]